MKWLNTHSFKYHIFLSFLIVALIPLIASSFIMVNVYTIALKHQMVSTGNQQIEELTNCLSNLFNSQEEACIALCSNDLVAHVLIDTSTAEYPKELYQTLYQVKSSLPTQTSFTIYDIGGHRRFSADTDVTPAIYPIHWGLLYKVRQNHSMEYYATDFLLTSESDAIIQSAYPVQNRYGSHLGYIVMGLTKDNLDVLFDGFNSAQDTIFITDSYLNLLYSTNSKYGEETITSLKNQSPDSTFWYAYAKEPNSGFYILLQKSSAISTTTVNIMHRISLITGLLCLSLCIILSFLLGRRLADPISRLNKAMDLVKAGDLTVHVSSNRNDEMGNLTENFNHMTMELKEYVERLVQRQKDLNTTKLRLFQTQLNPHFLYNTLDSIKWSAKIHKIEDIACMAENLAFILRKSISGNQYISLKQELETVENYISIQKIRFSDKFVYEAEIPHQLESCIVPKFLLQPIVENAIIHGLSDRDKGSILIYADQVGSNLQICVTDDGCGMSKEVIDWLNTSDITEKEGHLGLCNLNNIIKLYYGREYGLTATVEPGIGTTVTVVLPIRKENIRD